MAEQLKRSAEEYSEMLKEKRVVSDPTSNKNEVSHGKFPADYRVCPPGTMLTRDMREERLNVFTDSQDKVTHVTMG